MSHALRSASCSLLLACLLHVGAEAADWTYRGSSGPSTWKNGYPDCGGLSQSPINLKGGSLTHAPQPTWTNYNQKPKEMSLENNGHSLVIKGEYAADAKKPQIQIREKVYELDNVHFHFGRQDFEGSEHAFSHKKYALELHAVHKRVKNGATLNDILVVGVLYGISASKNPGIEQFINFASKIQKAETEYDLKPFSWSSIIPQFNDHFYTYKGSLTTPPCSEVVTWVVRRELSKVSHGQMELFRLLLNEQGEQMASNFRPLQLHNGRQVSYVKP